MRTRIRAVLICGVVTLAACARAAEPAAVASRVQEVTVYADRARVTRGGPVAVAQGTSVLAFGKLPGWIDEDSIRVAVAPAGAARILDVLVKREYLARAGNEDLRKAQVAVEEIADQIAALEDELKVLEEKGKQLESTRAFSLEKLPKDMAVRDVDIASYGKAVDYVADALRSVAAARREANRKRRELAPELSARQRKIEELQRLGQLEQCTVLVTLDAPAAAQSEVRLTYLMPGATWEPAHELRAAGATPQAVQLASYAVLSQTTGEDWEDAALFFSTQSPAETIRIPELETLLVGGEQAPARGQGKVSSFLKAQQRYTEQNGFWFFNENPNSDVDYLSNRKRQEVMQGSALRVVETLRKRGTTAHFAGRGKPTVRSDGRAIRVPIGEAELAATARIIAAPEASLNAARTVELRNGTGQPLLPGAVALFQEGAFLGVTDLDFVADGESFAVFLGVADQIKLSRMLDRRKSSIDRGRRTRMQVAFDIVVENLAAQEVTLKLTDRVPVSENRDVEVKLGTIQPSAKPDSKGILSWELTLKPGEKRALRLEYSVEYPQDILARARETGAIQGAPAAVQSDDLYQQLESLEEKF